MALDNKCLQVVTNLRHLKTAATAHEESGGDASASSSSKLWDEHIGPLWRFWEGSSALLSVFHVVS